MSRKLTPIEAFQVLAAATEPADIRGPVSRAGYAQIQQALEIIADIVGITSDAEQNDSVD